MTPEKLGLEDGLLHLGFTAFVEDPRANPRAQVSKTLVTRAPSIDEFIDPSSYDMAVTVSQDFVNRVIGLSYARGYPSLRKLQIDGASPLEIIEPPHFRFDYPGDRGKLHIKARHYADDWAEGLALRDQVTFQLDVDARLVHTREGKLSVVVDSIDVDSLSMYTWSVRKLTRGLVWNKLRKKLYEAKRDLRKRPRIIVEELSHTEPDRRHHDQSP